MQIVHYNYNRYSRQRRGSKQTMLLQFKYTVCGRGMLILVVLAVIVQVQSTRESALLELGYEQWEEPSAQELTSQYKLLTQQYKQIKNDPTATQKYNKIVSAYEELRKMGFDNAQDSNNQDTYSSRKPSQRRSRYDRYASQEDILPNPNRRNPKQGFFYQRSSYESDAEEMKQKLYEEFKNWGWDFMTMSDPQGDGSQQPLRLKLSFAQFIKWLIKNPQIVIAALLISFGIINLCTCCCCCCCFRCCRKGKGDSGRPSQANIAAASRGKANNRNWRNINSQYRRPEGRHLHQD